MKLICTICEEPFESVSSKAIYCPTCANTSSHQRNIIGWHMRKGRPLRTKKAVCPICGRTFYDAPDVKDFSPHYAGSMFCSHKCKRKFIKENGVCNECGKPLSEADMVRIPTGAAEGWFCSDECKDKHLQERTHKRYCETCGKEFFSIRKSVRFCSKECHQRDIEWKKKLSITSFKKFLQACSSGDKTAQAAYLKKIGFKDDEISELGF